MATISAACGHVPFLGCQIFSDRQERRIVAESAELLRSLGLEVDEYYGVGLPDFTLKWLKEKVAIGGRKAFTLSRE